MLNKVMLIGRLGQDPEVKYTPQGDAVANFSIATSETWKDKNTQEKREKTTWHRIVVWRKLGELCGQYLSKGKLVYIEGKIQTRSWEKDGQTHYATDIVADTVRFLSPSDGGGQRNDYPGQQPGGRSQRQDYQPAMGDHSGPPDDDIPF